MLGTAFFSLHHIEPLHVADNLKIGCLQDDDAQHENTEELPEQRVRQLEKAPFCLR